MHFFPPNKLQETKKIIKYYQFSKEYWQNVKIIYPVHNNCIDLFRIRVASQYQKTSKSLWNFVKR